MDRYLSNNQGKLNADNQHDIRAGQQGDGGKTRLNSMSAEERHYLFSPQPQTDATTKTGTPASEHRLTNFDNSSTTSIDSTASSNSGFWSDGTGTSGKKHVITNFDNGSNTSISSVYSDCGYPEKIFGNTLHEDARQVPSRSSSLDSAKPYKISREVPKGREGMEKMTVEAYLLEKRGFSHKQVEKLPRGVLNSKLGDFEEFWQNKPLTFEKLGEVRPVNPPTGKEVGDHSSREEGSEGDMGRLPDNLERLETPTYDYNCGIYAMLGAVGYNMWSLKTERVVDEVKSFLVKNKQVDGVESEGDALDFSPHPSNDIDNKKMGLNQAFHRLRKKGHIEKGRGLRVYGVYKNGKTFQVDLIDSDPGKQPVCIFWDQQRWKRAHFEALVDTGKPSRQPIQVNESAKVDSPAKRELTELRSFDTSIVAKEGDGEYITDRYSLTKERLLDLVKKKAPTGYGRKYQEAIDEYCRITGPQESHLQEIVDLMEANSDAVSEWLFEHRNDIENFTARLANRGPTEQQPISPYTYGRKQFNWETPNQRIISGEA